VRAIRDATSFAGIGAIGIAAALWPAAAQTSPTSGSAIDPAVIEDLVVANRILADQGVLDGLGHVSIRHPTNPSRYLMSRSLAPALVTPDDIMEYDLDSNPVDAKGRSSFIERFIHGEIYKLRPDVTAVIHSHSPSVIPFGISQVPMRATYVMASFLAAGVPVFDIRKAGSAGDLLVRNAQFGKALAETLGDKNVVLMRGHGEAVVAASLQRSCCGGSTRRSTPVCRCKQLCSEVRSPISIRKKGRKTKPIWRWRRLGHGTCGSARRWRR
jgi:ribulose-5-phosphate 4-epimerase/fuculose-1-phosphate aldolase